MATPLTAIGRYTGVLMAVLCALLMFTFVIGDSLMQSGGGRGGSADGGQVVATWNGGQINERQLSDAVRDRNILAQFQEQVIRTGAQAAQEDGVDLQFAQLRMQPLDLPRNREEGVEGSVVRTKIFAQKAADAGMVVTDERIADYFAALGFDRVSFDQMREMLKRMNTGGGSRATIGSIFELVRESMLASNYLMSHQDTFRTILPEERWDDWRKVNERVVVEAAPIKTADFIDQVPEPTDEELEAFYADYRLREPTTERVDGVELPSRLPAFATPPRVKMSVLKADYEALVATTRDSITDEEIAAYYEENKESFVAADTSLFDDDSLFEPSDLLSEEDAAEASEDEKPAEEAEDAATEPAEEETPAEQQGAEAPAKEDASEVGDAAESEAEAEDANEEEEEEEEASENDAEPAADSETKYQPLEEVADDIRDRLARGKAVDAIRQKMDRIQVTLTDAYEPLFDARLDAQAGGDESELPEPPTELTNLQPLAEAEQLELTEIDLATQMELRETPLGRSGIRAAGQLLEFWFVAFRDGEIDTYEPKLVYSTDGSIYLVLITERYDALTPELEDIRDRVVAEWKRLEAAKLALAAAEKLAEEAAPTGQTLAEFLTAKEDTPVSADAVEKTDPFALLTIGRMAPSARQIPLQLSQPEPLVAAGPELLQGVFELDAGGVGAELNHDHSIVYLLRIAQKIGTENELRREFLRAGDRWLGSQTLGQGRATQKAAALLGTLLDESGLAWERPADEVR